MTKIDIENQIFNAFNKEMNEVEKMVKHFKNKKTKRLLHKAKKINYRHLSKQIVNTLEFNYDNCVDEIKTQIDDKFCQFNTENIKEDLQPFFCFINPSSLLLTILSEIDKINNDLEKQCDDKDIDISKYLEAKNATK